ncbi:hypothetical protein A2415_03390 [candidate division WWE3 bacterium RIFOXYC1_FULL_39_7]|uniref:Peptidase C39-like domain-containing protein n=2 Tax=Katanobacteria TaxID=422282 RepID=A0A1F4X9J8_UNCKA|nr:MAG: hypothetical protein A2415_03390 [candidate division WWE3 bacterium RIFOXYC1_FULL_39_7]OGC78352.1 MAG: hypothetical protein A2619_04975 [candidate division WWE3 bacterium RIFOXYD1_FULL_39_9]
MKRYILLALIIIFGLGYYFKDTLLDYFIPDKQLINAKIDRLENKTSDIFSKIKETNKEQDELPTNQTSYDFTTMPSSRTLQVGSHAFQTFNNCGPASLSMALSYYDIKIDQLTLGQDLRPYQNARGDNDDKSVTLQEMASRAEKEGFIALHRPNGNMDLLQKFIAIDIPVITRTWLKENEDIGHFRVVKGYDKTRNILVQDDSLQGKDLEYTEDEFDVIWKKFNYEYLVLIPASKESLAREILGDNYEAATAWRNAVEMAQTELELNPDDIYARFNKSVALHNIGEYQKSVDEYEQVATRLSPRTLWYQIEPILSYYRIGEYDKVFEITNNILNNHNRAYSELYVVRGDIYYDQGDMIKAKEEYEKAVYYNKNLKLAQDAINKVK